MSEWKWVGKVRVRSTGYDPDGPPVHDPTLGPQCRHDVKWTDVRGVWCRRCGQAFAPVRPAPAEPEEDAR
jgi:hypothetical protein